MKIQFSFILIIVTLFAFSACKGGDKGSHQPKEMKHAEKPAEKPMEKPAEKPMETAVAEKPAEKPMETAVAEKPAEKPMETAVADKPAEKPMETAAADTGKGKKLFQKHGCKGCHFKKKGLKAKPFPSLQDMAQMSFDDFKKVVLEGRAGTAMTAKNVPDEELKAMYAYLTPFK